MCEVGYSGWRWRRSIRKANGDGGGQGSENEYGRRFEAVFIGCVIIQCWQGIWENYYYLLAAGQSVVSASVVQMEPGRSLLHFARSTSEKARIGRKAHFGVSFIRK